MTELVTGIDLVEQMIRVASGEKLAMTQGDVKLNGWAIESRLYAEDPFRNFLPSIGRLSRYRPPVEASKRMAPWCATIPASMRAARSPCITTPMIAKLCTWGQTREVAIDAMAAALNDFEVEGIGHNLPFLSAVMAQERFRSGKLTTAYIAEEFRMAFPVSRRMRRLRRSWRQLRPSSTRKFKGGAAQISGTIGNHSRKVGKDWVVKLGDVSHAVDAFRRCGC